MLKISRQSQRALGNKIVRRVSKVAEIEQAPKNLRWIKCTIGMGLIGFGVSSIYAQQKKVRG